MDSSSEIPDSQLSPKPSYASRADSQSSDAGSASDYATTKIYMNPLLEVIGQELDRRDGSAAPRLKKRHVTNLPPEEKRQRRLQRNRVAAKECRKKKKEYVESMEVKLKALELQNSKLDLQVKELEVQLILAISKFNKERGRSIPLDALFP
ncbi:X-box-binding protein 1 [Massospora cicadina]|nr:X-box-binding protein 1 [Massospora cicadina]